jgi:hypothetical protein
VPVTYWDCDAVGTVPLLLMWAGSWLILLLTGFHIPGVSDVTSARSKVSKASLGITTLEVPPR